MRYYKEFDARFYCEPDPYTGEERFNYGRLSIDLNSVASFNSTNDPEYMSVTMANGVGYAIRFDYDEFKALVQKTTTVTQFHNQ